MLTDKQIGELKVYYKHGKKAIENIEFIQMQIRTAKKYDDPEYILSFLEDQLGAQRTVLEVANEKIHEFEQINS